MKKLNPEYIKTVAKEVGKCPYFTLLSMGIRDLDWGQSRLEVAIDKKHLQPFGMVHGGVYASLIDAAAFWAVYSQIEGEVGMTTVEMKLNYLAPASEGVFIGKGKSIKVGNTLCLGEASVVDRDGNLLAHGTATMMILKDLKIHSAMPLPPKFLDEAVG
ncbi:PaaI family thioesterase [Thermodesulfobacteriota bacterium]